MPLRGDFVKNLSACIPNDQRFFMEPTYDKSTYLTKVRRIQGREFDSYSKRDSQNLVHQGGDISQVDILKHGTRPDEYYNQEQKEKNLMERLDRSTMAFAGYEHRSKIRGIYRQDEQILNKDPYDL